MLMHKTKGDSWFENSIVSVHQHGANDVRWVFTLTYSNAFVQYFYVLHHQPQIQQQTVLPVLSTNTPLDVANSLRSAAPLTAITDT